MVWIDCGGWYLVIICGVGKLYCGWSWLGCVGSIDR